MSVLGLVTVGPDRNSSLQEKTRSTHDPGDNFSAQLFSETLVIVRWTGGGDRGTGRSSSRRTEPRAPAVAASVTTIDETRRRQAATASKDMAPKKNRKYIMKGTKFLILELKLHFEF